MIDVHAPALFAIGESLQAIRGASASVPASERLLADTVSGATPPRRGLAKLFSRDSASASARQARLAEVHAEASETVAITRKAIGYRFEEALKALDNDFRELDLSVSKFLFVRLRNRFFENGGLPTDDELLELAERVRDELSSRVFMAIEPSRAWAYSAKELIFGTEVADTFPSAAYDLDEAGKCYALGRSTACVFHLMRIVEIGMHTLCGALGTEFPDKGSWTKVLNERLEPAINALPEGKRKRDLQQARAHLHAIRLAWRNDTMHPKATYTDEEAGEVLRHVETFMKHLAGRLGGSES